jgi:hypothetical protein
MAMKITHKVRNNVMSLHYEGIEVGSVTRGGILCYIRKLPGGILVSSPFDEPTRIFPEGANDEAIAWAVKRFTPKTA